MGLGSPESTKTFLTGCRVPPVGRRALVVEFCGSRQVKTSWSADKPSLLQASARRRPFPVVREFGCRALARASAACFRLRAGAHPR